MVSSPPLPTWRSLEGVAARRLVDGDEGGADGRLHAVGGARGLCGRGGPRGHRARPLPPVTGSSLEHSAEVVLLSDRWHVSPPRRAFRDITDNACPRPSNLPAESTGQDVADALSPGVARGLPRHHRVRDGCKEVRFNVGVGGDAAGAFRRQRTRSMTAVVRPRPHSLAGATYRMETPIGTAFVTVNQTPGGDPFEVFVQVGKAGSDTMAVAEALGRLISLVLRLPHRCLPDGGSRRSSASSRGSAAASPRASERPRCSRCRTPSPARWGSTSASAVPRPGGRGDARRGTPPGRRSLQGVRAGDPRLRGRVQEVSVLRFNEC